MLRHGQPNRAKSTSAARCGNMLCGEACYRRDRQRGAGLRSQVMPPCSKWGREYASARRFSEGGCGSLMAR